MLKLKEIKKSDILKKITKRYGEQMAVVDEFMKSGMDACSVETEECDMQGSQLATVLRRSAKILGVQDEVTIYSLKGIVCMVKKGSEEK